MSASNIDARDKMRAKDINTALARGDRPPRPAPPPSPTPFPEPFLPPPSTMTRPSPRCINEKVEDSRNARNSQSIASHHALPNGFPWPDPSRAHHELLGLAIISMELAPQNATNTISTIKALLEDKSLIFE
ncbi:hypothetical protein CRG98_032729 [Punica granatum]|uniref:Uncharacterized protein n=1 Tax=Punica granatum TaxID=22663 RepID=A0A2I0ISD6_PUNGR|nr:hypothetical protein CRG98_032729 [Punica granatum]